MKASQLFEHDEGSFSCYFCGSSCSGVHKTKDYVKDTFGGREMVASPSSNFVCNGCVMYIGDGYDKMDIIDGSVKLRQNKRGMAPRMYSWLLTKDGKKAGTKAHIKEWRELVLNPPPPPFAIILTESGQKQLIFKAKTSFDDENYPVLLEEECIIVNKSLLLERIKLATKVSAVIGKIALTKPTEYMYYIKYYEYFNDTIGLEDWVKVYKEPISRLAAWLCPNKEESQNEHPAIERGTVQAETGGPDRPKQKASRNGNEGNRRGSNETLFDLCDPV